MCIAFLSIDFYSEGLYIQTTTFKIYEIKCALLNLWNTSEVHKWLPAA